MIERVLVKTGTPQGLIFCRLGVFFLSEIPKVFIYFLVFAISVTLVTSPAMF